MSSKVTGLSGHTVTGARAGTPVFMSHQQLRNYKYAQPEVDLWSVVAMLYWLLTGCFPRDFADRDPLNVILTQPMVPIADRGVKIPLALAMVIDRALDEEGGSLAFKTATELQWALRQAL